MNLDRILKKILTGVRMDYKKILNLVALGIWILFSIIMLGIILVGKEEALVFLLIVTILLGWGVTTAFFISRVIDL